VRDRFISDDVESKDHDYVVTGMPIGLLTSILKDYGSVNLVGKSFGVIKFKPEGKNEEIDFALPRREISTGQGHRDFDVHFDHNLSIEDDLGRRDFTMNAIAIDLKNKKNVIDPFNGREDIKNREIRVVFSEAFAEDPLRMLRAVQFAARFNFKISRSTILSMRKHADKIKTVSGERVFEEIKKIMLRADYPSTAFKLMHEGGILEQLFPELIKTMGVAQPDKHHNLDVFNHIMHAVDSVPSAKLKTRIAALFHDIAKPQTKSVVNGEIHFYRHEFVAEPMIDNIMKRLCAPTDLTEDVKKLVVCHMFPSDLTPSAVRRLIKRVGQDLIYDLIDLRMGDRIASGKRFLGFGKVGKLRQMVDEELAEPSFSLQHLAIKGQDLIGLGLKPGPMFSKILNNLLERVMEDPSLNDKEKLTDIVKKEFILVDQV